MALALIAAGFCVLVLGFFFFAQESFIFPAPARGRPMPAQLLQGPGFTALWFPPPRSDALVVVHFHGNGEDLADSGPIVDLYRGLDLGVLAVETPGYGAAEGKPSERTFYEAAEAALRWLRDEQHINREVLSGQSLGTGAAVEMAARGWGTRMILISPYTSMTALARSIFPWLPASLLLRHRFDSESKAARVQIAVLVIHGTDDEVVPFAQGRRLASQLPHAQFDPIQGGQHNDLLWLHAKRLRGDLRPFVSAR